MSSDRAEVPDSAFFEESDSELVSNDVPKTTRFRVVAPVANPATERNSIEMGALLARQQQGKVISLSIAKAHVHLDDPELKRTMNKSRKLLKEAVKVTKEKVRSRSFFYSFLNPTKIIGYV